MKALVFDAKPEEVIRLIQQAQLDDEAFLGENSFLRLREFFDLGRS